MENNIVSIKNELVILLHGILNSNKMLKGMEQFLASHGFEVLNIDYPSTKYSIEGSMSFVKTLLDQKKLQQFEKIHFVSFSMGGIITRALLNKYQIANLGKVVFIGTPHLGSEVADFVVKIKLLAKIFGPAIYQLACNREDTQKIMGKPYYKFGCIAGNKSFDPLGAYLIKQPSDGRVSLQSSMLHGSKNSVILPFSHLMLIYRKKVWEHVLSFILHGKFLLL